jgi:prevent-host-death family protein
VEVTVQEAKTQLSKLLRRVEAGEEVTIRRGKVPVAVLVRAPVASNERKIWGTVKGGLGPDFDEPLNDFAPFQ